jgi:hypothetical protein
MPSSGMWRSVYLVWTDVSEERISSIFRVEKSASEEPAWAGGCKRSTRRYNPEDGILHSHRRENLKSYKFNFIRIIMPRFRAWSVLSCLMLNTCATPIENWAGNSIIYYTSLRTLNFPNVLPCSFTELNVIERRFETKVLCHLPLIPRTNIQSQTFSFI